MIEIRETLSPRATLLDKGKIEGLFLLLIGILRKEWNGIQTVHLQQIATLMPVKKSCKRGIYSAAQILAPYANTADIISSKLSFGA